MTSRANIEIGAEPQGYVDRAVAGAYSKAQASIAALTNRTYLQVGSGGTLTTPNGVAFGGIVTARQSGLFDFSFAVNVTLASSAQITVEAEAYTSAAGGLSLSGGTAAGLNAMYASGTSTLNVNGGPSGTGLFAGIFNAPQAGALEFPVSWSGFTLVGGSPIPVAKGTQVICAVLIACAANVTLGGMTLKVFELP